MGKSSELNPYWLVFTTGEEKEEEWIRSTFEPYNPKDGRMSISLYVYIFYITYCIVVKKEGREKERK